MTTRTTFALLVLGAGLGCQKREALRPTPPDNPTDGGSRTEVLITVKTAQPIGGHAAARITYGNGQTFELPARHTARVQVANGSHTFSAVLLKSDKSPLPEANCESVTLTIPGDRTTADIPCTGPQPLDPNLQAQQESVRQSVTSVQGQLMEILQAYSQVPAVSAAQTRMQESAATLVQLPLDAATFSTRLMENCRAMVDARTAIARQQPPATDPRQMALDRALASSPCLTDPSILAALRG